MRRTSRWLMPALSLVLFFGAIGVAQAAGWWVTSGRETVSTGNLTADDLKGWMTLRQAADGLGVPVEELVALLEAPEAATVGPDTAFKDLEGLVPGFELTAYREVVRAHLGDRATGAPFSGPTAALPTTVPTTTVATADTSAGASASAPPSGTASRVPTGTPTGTPTGSPESGVRGSMTLREVAQANGIAVDRLLAQCRLPADLDPDLALRDVQDVVDGFEIQTVRDVVESLTR